MNNTRRRFIKQSGIISLGFIGLQQFASSGCGVNSGIGSGYGALLPPANDGILSLPKGFTAKVISRRGDRMSDGLISPGMHDGMGAFSAGPDKVILIRNHENMPGSISNSPFGNGNQLISKIDKQKIYDFGNGERICVGGTTTLVYNELTQKLESEYLSLIGTVRNCAGGITPWNSWITCEETVVKKGDDNGKLEKDHGYNFEVPASEKIRLVEPVPLKAMGRFYREAVAVHPATGIVYQTEDLNDGLFYRFLPNENGKLQKGGKLQCLVIKEWKSADTRNFKTLTTDIFPINKPFKVSWMDLDNVEAPDDDLRMRGFKNGGVRFARAEGIWYGNNELFFACTSGGKNGHGQIFRYVPGKFEGQANEKDAPATLELYLEPNNIDTFQHCDNLTVSPWGDVVICEDKHDPRVIGITPQGKTYVIAKNVGYRQSEFAGPVFSPSGKTLFVNIQSPGLTLAITGPWKKS